MKDKVYLLGLILVILSFIACVVSYYLIVFAFPVFIAAVVIVLASEKSFSTKIITVIVPLILYLPSTYLFLYAINYSTPKTFLIPAGYEGPIRIVYEEKCGESLHQEDGKKILRFPESGILVLNEKFDGNTNNDYYFIDKNGKRTKINQTFSHQYKTKTLPSILFAGAGTLGGRDYDIKLSDFYIISKDSAYDDKVYRRFDSITFEIVQACRMKY